MKSELIQILQDRGLIHQATNLDELDNLAASQKIIAYIGFDLTADSLHVGSLIQIMVMRWMKKLGHHPIVLLGEATTRIGDPTGKSSMRPMLSSEKIERNRVGIVSIFDRLLGHSQHISNATWFNDNGPSFMNFLSEYGRHFTVNKMLALESVKSRLNRQEPMTLLEFNYMLMQAVDFLKLFRTQDCMLQVGGSDQWGNITNGVDLIRRVEHAEAFGLTTPLMVNSKGEKMGKTVGGAIWLDPDKTSAFEFWQFWRNVEDDKVEEFLRLFTEISLDDIVTLMVRGINLAKSTLATEVTAMVHGRATAEDVAKMAAQKVPDAELMLDLPSHTISEESLQNGVNLAQILFDAGLVASKTEADKLANNGGIKINGKQVKDVRANISKETFGETFVAAIGKKKMIRVII